MDHMETKRGPALVIDIREERIDSVNAAVFKSLLVDAISRGRKLLVLDFSNVDFMDSSGLAALMSSVRSMGKEGEIVLAGLSPKIEKLFTITKLDRVFRIHENVDLALAEISAD